MPTKRDASTQQTWFFDLSEDELSYVLLLFGANLIPGLKENTISQKPQAEKEISVDILQRALLAKGYAILRENGEWELEPTFADLVKLLVKPTYILTMNVYPGATVPPTVTVCFASPGVMIAQNFPYIYSHRFGVFFSIPDYAGDIIRLLPTTENDAEAYSAYLPKAIVRDLIETSTDNGLVRSLLGKSNFQGQPLEIRPIQDLLTQRRYSVLLTMASMVSEVLTVKQLSILVSKNGYGLLFDDDPLRQDGDVRIELMPLSQLSNSVQTWLLPLSYINELA